MSTILNLSKSANGSMVTAMLKQKAEFPATQDFAYYDLQNMSSTNRAEEIALGLIKSTEAYSRRPLSIISKAFENKNFIYAKPGAKITWEEQIGIERNCILECLTEGDWLGADGTTFEIRTKMSYAVGDIISRANTYDADMEANFFIHDVYDSASNSGFIHVVSITPQSNMTQVSRAYLSAGVQLMFVDHPTGEYSTQLSGLEGFIRPSFMKKEVEVHMPTGVEAHVTAEGMITGIDKATKQEILGETSLSALKNGTEQVLLGLGMYYDKEKVGKMPNGEMTKGAFVLDKSGEKPMMLGLEFVQHYVIDTAIKKANARMMWSRGFNGKSQSNHYASSAPGAWVQIKNGAKKLEYSSIEKFSIANLAELSEAVYEGTGIQPENRIFELKCGTYINAKIQQIIQSNANTGMPFVAELEGLPDNPFKSTGTPYEWAYNAPRFTEGWLPGVGYVKTSVDLSFDSTMGDPMLTGMDGRGNTKSAYTIMVSSRNKAISEGLKKAKESMSEAIQKTGTDSSNIFIIRKADANGNPIPMISWGAEYGRSYGTGVSSVTKELGNTYWALVDGESLVLNPSDIVLMEKA